LSFLFNNNQPLIFISGIGQNGYIIIDLAGKKQSNNFLFLKNKKYSITDLIKSPKQDKIIYTLNPTLSKQNSQSLLQILDLNTNALTNIPNDPSFPKSPNSVSPIGWSKNQNYFYVTKICWEGFNYAGF